MPDDLDELIARQFEALEAVDVPDTWETIVARLDTERTAHLQRGSRWLLGLVAASVLVIVSAAIYFVSRETGSDLVTSQPPITSGTTSSPDGTIPAGPFGTAAATPSTVAPGAMVTIAPSALVGATCGGIGVVRALPERDVIVGQLQPDGPFLPGPVVTWLACVTEPGTESHSYTIPVDLAPGDYVLCVTRQLDAAGCATITVTPAAAPTTVQPAATPPPVVTAAAPDTVPPLTLSAEAAAELSAPGNVDAVALLDRLPASATFDIADCDNEGCSTETGVSPSNPTEFAARLQYVDLRLQATLLGVDPDVAMAGFPDVWLSPGVRATWPRFFSRDDASSQRADVGFATSEIIRLIDARRLLPRQTAVLDVAVAPAAIDTAVRTDPLWSPELAVAEVAGGTHYDWNADRSPFSQDLARTSPMRPLGVGGELLVTPADGGAHVIRTVDPDVIQGAIAGEASVLDAGPYSAALALLPDARIVQLYGASGLETPTSERADLASLTIDRYTARVQVHAIDRDGLRTDVFVIYPDAATAAANLDHITAITRNGYPPDPDPTRPYSAGLGFPDARIEQRDAIIHIAHRGLGNPPYPVHD